MDKSRLVEAVARRTAEFGHELGQEDAERVIDALFGTLDRPGVIAEVFGGGATVMVGSFGRFRSDNGSAVLEQGTALTEYLRSAVSRSDETPG